MHNAHIYFLIDVSLETKNNSTYILDCIPIKDDIVAENLEKN